MKRRSLGWLTLAVGTGAGLMYLLDPERGRARRAYLRDKGKHYAAVGRRMVEKKSVHVYHKMQGIAAKLRRLSGAPALDESGATRKHLKAVTAQENSGT